MYKIILMIAIFINTVFATQIELTQEEKQFIKNHPKIILGSDKTWEPFVVVTKDGEVTGYDQDVLNLINKITGANFIVQPTVWNDAVQKAKNGTIDGISTGAVIEARKKFLNSSIPYISMQAMYFTSTMTNKDNIQTVDDIDGKIIGIQKGNGFEKESARKFTNSKIIEYPDFSDLVEAVATQKVDVMMGDLATFYMAKKLEMPYLRPFAKLDKKLILVFSFRKDLPEAIGIINKALKHIGKDKLNELTAKWFGQIGMAKKDSGFKELLSSNEQKYLEQKKEIKMCVDPDWLPFEKIQNGKHIGIAADYIKIIAQQINIPITLVQTSSWSQSIEKTKNRECDIYSLVSKTPKREEYMDFITPYLKTPIVIATKKIDYFITDINYIIDKKIGIVKGYSLIELYKKRFPNINIVEVDSISDGLSKVEKGEIFGYLDNSIAITSQIKKEYVGILEISGKFDTKLDFGIATRNDEKELLSIFNKAIGHMDEKIKIKILNSWIGEVNRVDKDLIKLSPEEKKYLTTKKEINMCVDPNWMPFEKIDKNGNYQGILSEYIKLFSQRLNIE
ncbi:MAG: transporter substrate-binding domain-containing protein, partial [Campylobacterota bacterium]|nr:transporter substrate-binding domain-containing protein [Campylobacterota bacterium]